MKLLYVVHQFFPECFSGTEQYCLAAAREARRQGDEVTVLSLTPDFGHEREPLHVYEQPYEGLRVIRLRPWGGFHPNDVRRDYENPIIAARFRRLLRQLAPQAVHFFHLRHLGADLIDEARDAGARTVVHLMDYWYLCPRFTLLRADGTLCQGPPDGGIGCIPCHYPQLAPWTEPVVREVALAAAQVVQTRSIYNSGAARVTALLQRKEVMLRRLARADVVIAPSRFLAGLFEANGFPAQRITVVPYGLEPGRVVRAAVRRPRSPLRLGFCGVFSPWKAPHLAVDAVRAVPGALRLSVHGRYEEPMFAAYIAAMRDRAAGDPRISFPGPYDQSGLSQVMADLDLLIVPSTWYENTPFVILEALEAGVPVLAANLGGMAELVDEGRNGFTFAAGSAEALAAVLRRCLADPQLLARLEPRPAGTIADNYARFRAAYVAG